MTQGWIAIHREIEDNILWLSEPFSRGQAWIDLILMANHHERKIIHDGNVEVVNRGEKVTSLRYLSDRWRWSRTKTKKFLEVLASEKMIEYKSTTKKTTYKIVNYDKYQDIPTEEKATEKPQKNIRKTSEKHQKETNNNVNNVNNDNKYIYSPLDFSFDEVINYLNEKANKNYKSSTRKNQELIKARVNEGFKLDDFKKVIDNKVSQWRDDSKMNKYLRPVTLFGTKFESYLNEQPRRIEGNEIPSRDSLAYSDNRTTKEERDAIMEFKLRQRLPIKKKGDKNGK